MATTPHDQDLSDQEDLSDPEDLSDQDVPYDRLTVAICQTAGHFGDIEGTLRHLDTEAARAKAEGADILVLPELFLTGYNLGEAQALALAQTSDGAALTQARAIARSHAIALVFGYPEKVGDGVANSSLFVGSGGQVLLNYRKVHLFGALDRGMFKVLGERFPVVAYRGWSIGMMICYDVEFPETARLLAVQGAECLLIPTALMTPYDVVPRAIIPARAYENTVYVAYANHCGAEAEIDYIGHSCICGPDGIVLATAGTGAAMIKAVMEKSHLAAVRAGDPLLRDRRPALYGGLTRA